MWLAQLDMCHKHKLSARFLRLSMKKVRRLPHSFNNDNILKWCLGHTGLKKIYPYINFICVCFKNVSTSALKIIHMVHICGLQIFLLNSTALENFSSFWVTDHNSVTTMLLGKHHLCFHRIKWLQRIDSD